MPAHQIIPVEIIPDILAWYLRGKSTRDIHERLVARGVNLASHTSVWDLIQKLGDGRGNAVLAAIVSQCRQQAIASLEKMAEVEDAFDLALQRNASDEWVERIKKRLSIMNSKHRAHMNRLRIAGATSKAGQEAYAQYAGIILADKVKEEAVQHTPWPWPAELELGPVGKLPDTTKLFGFNEANPLKTLPSIPNTPSPTPRPEQAPKAVEKEATVQPKTNKVGRNELCPCGSGQKFKKCCLDKPAPAPDSGAHAPTMSMN